MDDSRIESQIINSLIFKSSPAYYVWTGLYLHSKHRHCSHCAIKIKIITVSSTHLSGDWRHFGSFFYFYLKESSAASPLSLWSVDLWYFNQCWYWTTKWGKNWQKTRNFSETKLSPFLREISAEWQLQGVRRCMLLVTRYCRYLRVRNTV